VTRRRRAIGLATVGLIAAAAVAAALALGGDDGGGNGPLDSPDADETTLTIRPGGRMTWGQPI
jgi:hypothetical protein